MAKERRETSTGQARKRQSPDTDSLGSEREGGGDKAAAIPELIRRAMAVGLSGFFTTEEAFRRALGDAVPQDWVDFAVGQSDRTRGELLDRLAREFGRVLEGIDPVELAQEVLKGRSLHIDARIRLASADESRASDEIRVSIEHDEEGEN